jgi:hypothetical protein
VGEYVFRRMRGLVTLGVVLFLSVPVGILTVDYPGDLGVLAIVLVASSIYCVFDYLLGQRLLLDEITITDHRFVDAMSVSIPQKEVGTCKYKPIVLGKPLYFRVIEIQDKTGEKIIDIRRYGWGRKRRELFSLLNAWISHAEVEIDDKTRSFLAKASR